MRRYRGGCPTHCWSRSGKRTPAAIWQDNGQLTLIDASGALLDPVNPDAMPDLPLVIGPGADRQEAGYQRLLAAAPALKPRVTAATWVGNRRWDLTFDSGETLKLPEDGAADALVTFAEKDGAHPLLGRGWLSFDMRDPSRLVRAQAGRERRAQYRTGYDRHTGGDDNDHRRGLRHNGEGCTGRTDHRARHRIVEGVSDDRAEGGRRRTDRARHRPA